MVTRSIWSVVFRVIFVCGIGLGLAACSSGGSKRLDYSLGMASQERQRITTYSPRVVSFGQPVPKGGGRYKLGKPYRIAGKLYVPRHDPDYSKTGIASWYGKDFHGRLTANGEVYDMNALTAAHPTLPLPSLVMVTNTANGRRVVVRVNDRGPFARNRIIDLSHRAARVLGLARQGTGRVHVRYVGPAPL